MNAVAGYITSQNAYGRLHSHKLCRKNMDELKEGRRYSLSPKLNWIAEALNKIGISRNPLLS